MKTISGYKFKMVEHFHSNKVLIEFEDGEQLYVKQQAMYTGEIEKPTEYDIPEIEEEDDRFDPKYDGV